MDVQKDDETPKPGPMKWAIITLHPYLPSQDEQTARARAWGIPESMLGKIDASALIIDDVRKQKPTTKWAGKLPKREAFLGRLPRYVTDGGAIFFATPLCVGFGKELAMDTVNAIWAAGMQVYVHTPGALYEAGDNMDEFLRQLSHEANVAYARKHRKARKTKDHKRLAPRHATDDR